MDASPFTAVARVVKTHGLDGEVHAALLLRGLDASALDGAELWPVPPRGAPRPLHVSRVRSADAGGCLLAFQEASDVGTAKRLVGSLLLARASDLPAAEEPAPDEVDGFEVIDAERGPLGTVVDVIVTGANDVWVVHGPLGEVLLPVIDDVVLDVDHERRVASVRLLPGLIDED
ncbi:ribosome maturation factor RimM [Coriobacteriia bacterium Es71-Z0120]|uniref:ribosome maturation factor RimM n=1 Tax=Parvivirga hydrogeniphila TaxID=2939460 RepID=UPI002260DF56|nr:ribosome maturation factor RimM [Parvivirga hydrogeniphila]MCL4079573.1 ribosome maturation factor RimM [Parvivirga hydrogeniphila]